MATNWAAYLRQAAAAYGANPDLVVAVNQRENSGRSSFDVNDWDSNAKAGIPSGGPFQFIQDTFNTDAALARKANPAAWKGVPLDWKNPKAQALAASWAFANGKGGAWSTYKAALADAGGKAKGSGKAPADAPATDTLGMGAELPGLPAVDPVATRIAALGAARAKLKPKTKADTADHSINSLRDRTDSLRQANADFATWAKPDVPDPVTPAATPVSGPDPALPTNGGANEYKNILKIGSQFGLHTDGGDAQTTGGKHATGSYHYQGRAVDFGDAKNSPDQLKALASWARAHAGEIKELFYNPLGWGIKNGKIVKGLTVAGHDDHLHLAI